MKFTQTSVRISRFVIAAALFGTWLYWLNQWAKFPTDSVLVEQALFGFGVLGLAAWICPIEQPRLRIAARILGTLVGLTSVVLSMLLVQFVMDGP
jgi:hypothetical protein